MDSDSGALTEELVMCRLVCVLNPSPTAQVINKDRLERTAFTHHVLQEASETLPML
jgi:hypothetical protein